MTGTSAASTRVCAKMIVVSIRNTTTELSQRQTSVRETAGITTDLGLKIPHKLEELRNLELWGDDMPLVPARLTKRLFGTGAKWIRKECSYRVQ